MKKLFLSNLLIIISLMMSCSRDDCDNDCFEITIESFAFECDAYNSSKQSGESGNNYPYEAVVRIKITSKDSLIFGTYYLDDKNRKFSTFKIAGALDTLHLETFKMDELMIPKNGNITFNSYAYLSPSYFTIEDTSDNPKSQLYKNFLKDCKLLIETDLLSHRFDLNKYCHLPEYLEIDVPKELKVTFSTSGNDSFSYFDLSTGEYIGDLFCAPFLED